MFTSHSSFFLLYTLSKQFQKLLYLDELAKKIRKSSKVSIQQPSQSAMFAIRLAKLLPSFGRFADAPRFAISPSHPRFPPVPQCRPAQRRTPLRSLLPRARRPPAPSVSLCLACSRRGIARRSALPSAPAAAAPLPRHGAATSPRSRRQRNAAPTTTSPPPTSPLHGAPRAAAALGRLSGPRATAGCAPAWRYHAPAPHGHLRPPSRADRPSHKPPRAPCAHGAMVPGTPTEKKQNTRVLFEKG